MTMITTMREYISRMVATTWTANNCRKASYS
jgi:hypothetical protein